MSVRLLAFAGSTRAGSYNQRLLDLAAEAAQEAGATVTPIRLRDFPLPLYDGDLEAQGAPAAARDLKALFVAHDGFLIASPEYNGSISGTLKNAIDWVSRPSEGETALTLAGFRGKAAGVMSASIGPFGGLRSLTHLRQILGTVQTLVANEQVMVPFADKAFDGAQLTDPTPKQLLPVLVKRVVALASFARG